MNIVKKLKNIRLDDVLEGASMVFLSWMLAWYLYNETIIRFKLSWDLVAHPVTQVIGEQA